MEDKCENLIASIIMASIIILFVIIAVICIISDKPQHNNGICTECGGQYEFVQAVGHKFDTSYIYKCNECGKIIETDYLIK